MTKTPLLSAALSGMLLLGGCMGTENRGLESVHQPVVARADYALDLATSRGALAPGERQRLAGWMAAMRLGYGDRVAIDDPAAMRGPAHDEVAGAAARYGLLLDETAAVSSAPVTPGTLRVVVTRMRASTPGCPDWSRDASHEYDSNTSSNYGCSTNGNLAAMIANPADLVRGAAGSPTSDNARSTRVIDTYNRGAAGGAGGTGAASGAGAAGGAGGAAAGGAGGSGGGAGGSGGN